EENAGARVELRVGGSARGGVQWEEAKRAERGRGVTAARTERGVNCGKYEPMGYYGQYEPMGYYGQTPEMPGYAEHEPLAEDYPLSGYYGEPDMSGYVRETEPTYNPGCPLPTNVSGFGEPIQMDGLEGYIKPTTVNPSCGQFTEQPGPTPGAPEGFKPLW